MRPKPDLLYTLWTADEVAECTEGLNREDYAYLWNEIVPLQPRLDPDALEDTTLGMYRDQVQSYSLATFWDQLPIDMCERLNALAPTYDD